MASSTLISFRPSPVIASARSKPGRGSGGGGSWWTPLFGWPSTPDYVEAAAATESTAEEEGGQNRRRKFGGLTEEKARELRMRTWEMETFHDVMYHSAIASRLASDLNRRSEIKN